MTDINTTTNITESTVLNRVGLCYLDPITENLIELNQLPNHFLSVEPFKKAIRKYYLITTPGDPISYIKVSINGNDRVKELYSLKQVASNFEPSLSMFDDLINMNTLDIQNPDSGAFIPVWVYIESKIQANEILDLSIEIEYE